MTDQDQQRNQGLFVGLVTLDFIYGVAEYPNRNQKIVASDYTVAAGGPATNAAVTFSYLGNWALLWGVVGIHPITQLIHADLQQQNVTVLDLDPDRPEPPPVSSIIVSQGTGDRTVVSINAIKSQASPQAIPEQALQDVQVVLMDGHQMAVSEVIAQQARRQNIPVVLDGGSWKLGLEALLPWVDYAICSANFYPPHCQTQAEVFAYLNQFKIPFIAITQGESPIQFLDQGKPGSLTIPPIHCLDSLGAGDIFHGAFCHEILQQPFVPALNSAAAVASHSCQFFGTRQWMGSRDQTEV
ncbi:MAG: sugar kinase [Microcoleaceae cyanobacterium]